MKYRLKFGDVFALAALVSCFSLGTIACQGVAPGAQLELAGQDDKKLELPSGAVIIEEQPLGSENHPDRALILWMVNPAKNPSDAQKDPEEPYTCPDETRGSCYSGPTRVSLINTTTQTVINTIEISVLAKQRDAINRNDPALSMICSTFLGGSQVDDCDAVATDQKGNIYLGCHSDSPNLPGSASAPYALKGDLDAFVIKLDPNASRVLYLAQIGGREWEGAMGIAVDSSGSAYITGSTYSPDFSTTAGAFQREFAGDNDAFVVKVSPTGSVVYATFLGGKGRDDGRRIAIDRSGAAYIIGSTNSPDFPSTAGAVQTRYGGDTDAFVAKLSPSGALLYSTYLGGSAPDNGFDIAVNSSGSAYVTGNSRSTNFPIKKPIQNSLRGDSDAFIARLNTTGSALFFSTYLGGNDFEYGNGIALDALNGVFLTGSTMSPDFPTSRGAFQTTYGGKWDGFVTKLAPSGANILYSSYLGGSGEEGGAQIAVSPNGRAYIVGGTESGDFPTARPAQASLRGTKDGFLVEVGSAGASLLFSTYLGGGKRELFEDVALDAKGSVILSGLTSSDDFPVVRGMQNAFGGAMYDIFVAKFARAEQYRARKQAADL